MSKASSTNPPTFSRLRDALADGRLDAVFFRRDQLSSLHKNLLRHQDKIINATVQDAGHTRAEALVELYLVLTALKRFLVDDLAADKLLSLEYRIAHGCDAAEAKDRIGIALIVPQAHTIVYSVVVPVAAALAAGNAVAIVLEQTLQSLPVILAEVLRESLDASVFEIFHKCPKLAAESDIVSVVQKMSDDKGFAAGKLLLSPSQALSVAIVDRTANVDQAALDLVRARMGFGGRSPYAPDIVLVNEFVLKAFLKAAMQQCVHNLVDSPVCAPSPASAGEKIDPQAIRTIATGANGGIFEVLDRNTLASLRKTRHKALYIHGYSSLDDAIECIIDMTTEPSLAIYANADLASCKYLLQYLPAYAGFSNGIPTELLVGPAAPLNAPIDLLSRYTPQLFSVPYPKLLGRTTLSYELNDIMLGKTVEAQIWKKVEVEDREPVRIIHGYFETAALVGLVTRLSPLLAGLGYLAFKGVQKAARMN